MTVKVETWQPEHPQTEQVTTLIEQLEQTGWVKFTADWHLSSHMLVAHENNQVQGFLRYVIQEIGVEQENTPVKLNDKILTEAKVLAFGVDPVFRRQGIGRALQQHLITTVTIQGCYQIRSHSAAHNYANHQLKLSLGYAVHPLPDTDKCNGAYFLLQL